MSADDSALKYRALLQISEALIACRDRDALVHSLWEALHPLIAFDYLVIMRYDAVRRLIVLKAIAGMDRHDPDRPTEWPVEGSPLEVMLETKQPLYVPDISLETRFRPDLMEVYRQHNIRSGFWIDLTTSRGMHGAIAFSSCQPNAYTPEDREFMQHIGRQVAIANENAVAFEEINELRRHIEDEKVYLEEEIRSEYRFDEIVGSGPALRGVLQQIQTAAPTDSSILIQGETGTGKELVARAIHRLSSRANATFVKLNCAAIPAGLIESELLGHEKGAFTGAVGQRIGRFELAHRGTLFLDEIGEMPLEMQPKLLRVLQDGQFERLGGTRTMQSDFRLVAATNRDLRAMVAEQQFRADLFYRVNVFPIILPALRERREDIPDASPLFRPGIRDQNAQEHRVDSRGSDGNVGKLFLARQHPRASQHHRAIRHPYLRQAPHHSQRRPARIPSCRASLGPDHGRCRTPPHPRCSRCVELGRRWSQRCRVDAGNEAKHPPIPHAEARDHAPICRHSLKYRRRKFGTYTC